MMRSKAKHGTDDQISLVLKCVDENSFWQTLPLVKNVHCNAHSR